MERNIVLELSEDVTDEQIEYYARVTKQMLLECKWVKAVYVERKTEQEEWRITDDVLEPFADDEEDM
jgi:hypothetical protein